MAKKKAPWIVGSRDQVAEFFRVTDRTVASWIGQGMPRIEVSPRRFDYDLAEVLRWRSDLEDQKRAEEAESESDPRLAALKIAKLEQEVRIKTVEADEREGLVVSREEAHEAMAKFAHRMRLLGELFKRQNPDALGPLNVALEDSERIMSVVIDGDSDSNENGNAAEAVEDSGD